MSNALICCTAMFVSMARQFAVLLFILAFSLFSAEAFAVTLPSSSPVVGDNQSSHRDTLSVSINFRRGYSNLDLDFMGNKEALDEFVKAYHSLTQDANNNNPYVCIYEYGFASPEGAVAVNQRLSKERAAVVTDYLQKSCNISPDSIVGESIGVDWQDLYTYVQADQNVPAREKVLDIITNVTDIVKDSRGVLISQRNKLLQRLENGRTWNYLLENIYPHLRGAKVEVVCSVDSIYDSLETTSGDSISEPAEDLAQEEERDTTVSLPPPPVVDEIPQPQEEHLLRYPIAAVRSNLLLPLLNVGVEVPVSKHWSIGADYYYPWLWPAKENKNCFELIFVSAEARYWFNPCKGEVEGKNYLVGHSVAAYGAWGYYDLEHNYHGHQGSVYSAGLDYVYALPIAKQKLRLEFQVAVGAIWSPRAQPYNVYEEGGQLIREKGVHKNFTYFGPTKVGVSLVLPLWRKVKHGESLLP